MAAAVLTMLQRRVTPAIRVRTPSVRRSTSWLWVVMGADLAAVIWLAELGVWLDQTSRLTAIVTLGGHHVLVMVLAGIAFGMLATAAVMTSGFSAMTRSWSLVTTVACVMSVVVLAGALSFLLLGLLARLAGLFKA
jgi:hypothetical protein